MTVQRDFDLQVALDEYPDMERFLGTFQIRLHTVLRSNGPLRHRNLKDYIVVFKKKKLHSMTTKLTNNYYWDNVAAAVNDPIHRGKASGSCLRCRKFKKKCSRQLPECLNCTSCDEFCVYPPQSMKHLRLSLNKIDKHNTSMDGTYTGQRRCSDVYRLLN